MPGRPPLLDLSVISASSAVSHPISKNRRSTTDKRSPIAYFSVQLPRQLIEPSRGAKPIAPLPATRREHLIGARSARARQQTRRAKAHSKDGMARATGRRTCAQSKNSKAPVGNRRLARWSRFLPIRVDQRCRGFESDVIRHPK